MVWSTPNTNWQTKQKPLPADFNRMEGNHVELKKAATIDLQDTAGLITATDVETALQELHPKTL